MRRHSNPFVPPIPGFENPPILPPRLRRAPSNEYLHVREVKGGAFQARVWLGAHAGGSLNLGLFTVARWETREHAEWAAGRASREFRKRFRPGMSLRAALESLIRDRFVPDHVLPPRVRATADGDHFFGRVKLVKAGRVIETTIFADAWDAYRELVEVLAREFPRGPSKGELRERDR